MTFTIDEFAELKQCRNYEIMKAYSRRELDGHYIKVGTVSILVIKMNSKSDDWEPTKKPSKTFHVPGKKHLGDAYHYRNDLMGQYCKISLNTEFELPHKNKRE